MKWFNIPKQCILEKEIPLDTLMRNIRNRNTRLNDIVLSNVESCSLYVCLNENTYPINCKKQDDAYFNEVIFLSVKINDYEKCELLAKYLLRVFDYQTVIVFQRGDESCIAIGFVRDAKKVIGNRKVVQYEISRWLLHDESTFGEAFDMKNMDVTSYESIHRSIYNAIKAMDNERYLTLSFVAELYAYSHGIDVGWPANFEVHKKLKELFPQNRIKVQSGNEAYRFTEDEALEIMHMGYGYVGIGGVDLIETLHNLVEYENDFNVELPERIKDKVYDFQMQWFEDMEDVMYKSDEELDREIITGLLTKNDSTAEEIEFAIELEKRIKR